MKSTVIVLSLAILVAVVFSAPARSNNGNQQIQGFGSSVDNTQFEESKQFGNNGQVQGPANTQFQGSINVQFQIIPSGDNGQFQGVIPLINNGQFQGNQQLGTNGQFRGNGQTGPNSQFQGVIPVVNNGKFPSFRPFNDNSTEEVSHPPKGFNFQTGAPRHPGDVTGEPSALIRPIFANSNQQGARGKRSA